MVTIYGYLLYEFIIFVLTNSLVVEFILGKIFSSVIMRRWCSGNMKPFQGLASGSIPERRTLFALLPLLHYYLSQ